MFDGLLKSKFYSKCKSALKLTKTRIDMIKRKRAAMQKYLKNDIVDLLKTGLDTNAYGRVEGLWNELNFSSCYDFVEQFCNQISSHLVTMDKQRECPEECKEAASSLSFAAARFSDLPELRELRTIFTERYGNSIEFHVNKEFVHKLKSIPPSREAKLQLMQEMASDAGLQWDSKTFEQKLHKNTNVHAPDSKENGNHEKSDSAKGNHNGDHKMDKKDNAYPHSEERTAAKDVVDGQKFSHLSYGEPVKDIHVDRIDRKVEQKETVAVRKSEEENNEKEPSHYKSIPPPYTKRRLGITKTTLDVSPTGAGAGSKVQEKAQKTEGSSESVDQVRLDESAGNMKPKPRSVRSRVQKTWLGQDKVANATPVAVGSEHISSTGVTQPAEKELRQHLQILKERKHDVPDEEEKAMDRLLLHYSGKKLPPDNESEGEVQPSPQKFASQTGRGVKHRGRDGLAWRTSSFPTESSPTEPTRLSTRATSFQPEALNSNENAHSKPLEYDDFVARLAALQGTLKR